MGSGTLSGSSQVGVVVRRWWFRGDQVWWSGSEGVTGRQVRADQDDVAEAGPPGDGDCAGLLDPPGHGFVGSFHGAPGRPGAKRQPLRFRGFGLVKARACCSRGRCVRGSW